MGIIVDIIILAIIALAIFVGYRKGLIKCAINVLSFFIAIVVVILLTTPISNIIINNTKIDDNIKITLLEKFNFENLESKELKLDEENSDSPKIVREYVNDMMKDLTNTENNKIADELAKNISIIIINIVVAIVLFIGTKFALIFVKVLADIVGRIPLIKQFNKIGGIIYGIANGIVKIYLILAIISIIAPLLTDSSLINAINQSMLGKIMYDNNLLLKIIL